METLRFRGLYEGSYRDVSRVPDRKTGNWRLQRPVINMGKCCQCGWCFLFCPSGSMEDKGSYFSPNLDYCKGCGICAKECTKSAIAMVREGAHL